MGNKFACSSATLRVSLPDRSSLSSSRCTLAIDLVGMPEIPESTLAGRGCWGSSQVCWSGFAPGWQLGVWEEKKRLHRSIIGLTGIMACKFSLVLAHQDALQLAMLVDDVFNRHNNSLYVVVSKLELLRFITASRHQVWDATCRWCD